MTAVSIIIDIVLILVSIILIVTVLMQEGQRQGLGAIGGGAETFFGTSHEYLHSPIGQKYLELEGGELHCSKHWHSISPIPSSDTP